MTEGEREIVEEGVFEVVGIRVSLGVVEGVVECEIVEVGVWLVEVNEIRWLLM